jgi:pimeloyl-ACP methyl ester carboxylesterase
MHRSQPLTRAGLIRQLLAMTGWSSIPWLHTIRAPTLVLVAGADPIVPLVNGRILVSRLQAGTGHLVPDAGHLFLIDQAEDAAGVIERFLESAEIVRADRESRRS